MSWNNKLEKCFKISQNQQQNIGVSSDVTTPITTPILLTSSSSSSFSDCENSFTNNQIVFNCEEIGCARLTLPDGQGYFPEQNFQITCNADRVKIQGVIFDSNNNDKFYRFSYDCTNKGCTLSYD